MTLQQKELLDDHGGGHPKMPGKLCTLIAMMTMMTMISFPFICCVTRVWVRRVQSAAAH
jgi:hypothetical protein